MISDTESVAGCDVMQMESHNQELADENCSLRDEIERLRSVRDSHPSKSSSAKVSVIRLQ